MSDEAQILPPGVTAPEGAIDATSKKKGGRPGKKAAAGTKLVVPEEQVAELQQLRDTCASDLKQVQDFPLETQEQVEMLTSVGVAAGKQQAELEARRKKITDPLDAAKKEVKALFDPPIEFLKSIKAGVKMRLESRLQAQRQAQTLALAAVGQNAGHVNAATLAAATGAEHVRPAEGSYEVESFDFEIADLSQLLGWALADGTRFVRFFLPNEHALKTYATENKQAAVDGQAQIPGVRFFAKRRLVMRGQQ